MIHRRHLLRVALVALASLAAAPVHAQTKPSNPRSDPDKPFATRFIALQLSDADPKKQRLVLSVASNLIKEYGPDNIAVEVVAFGPGIGLLTDTSEFRVLVDSLVTQGIRFDVCGNTLDTIERETGSRPKLNPHAVEVQVGVGQLLSLSENGYTIVRP
jgi:intracellular sulfur oxidation DsrE/DsrF family protein